MNLQMKQQAHEFIMSYLFQQGIKNSGNGEYRLRCPKHTNDDGLDKNPSFNYSEEKMAGHCWSCPFKGDAVTVAEALGWKYVLNRQGSDQKKSGNIEATYDYKDKYGELLFQCVRYTPKEFRQRKPGINGEWIWNLKGVKLVPYKLPELIDSADKYALLLEGEKDVETAIKLGFTATCNPMGALKWKEEFNSHLQKFEKIYLIPDNDETGKRHSVQVYRSLSRSGIQALMCLPLPGNNVKDLTDWVHAGGTKEQLIQLLKSAEYIPEPKQDLRYRETPSGIIYIKQTRDGEVDVPLTNFNAKIISEIIRDFGDDCEPEIYFEIEVYFHGSKQLILIPARQFPSMNWATEKIGAKAIVHPGSSLKDHTRAAIQSLSSDITKRRIYMHTGWRLIEDNPYYLHAGGAISADGLDNTVKVDLPHNLSPLNLPDPNTMQKEDILKVLSLLNLAPDNIITPILVAPFRAVIDTCDFSIHLAGPTGSGKTELAALATQFFGKEFNSRKIPASWASTANSIEMYAFIVKDALLVVDDFAPGGTIYEVAKFHRDADRILRAQGNNSGRSRMRADGTVVRDKYPRGMIISTGEDIPSGQSLRARMLIIEVGKNDLDWNKLSELQLDASGGVFERVLSAFIRFIASDYKTILLQHKKRVLEIRDKIHSNGLHRRTSPLIAELLSAAYLFIDFAKNQEAIDDLKALEFKQIIEHGLKSIINTQKLRQQETTSELRFLEVIGSAISTKRAHLEGKDSQEPPDPERYGWVYEEIVRSDSTQEVCKSRGQAIGWTDGNNIYLDPNSSFSLAQCISREQGTSIGLTKTTLWKRLFENGYISERDVTRQVFTVRHTIQEIRKDVIVISVDTLFGFSATSENPDQPDHKKENSENEKVVGMVGLVVDTTTDKSKPVIDSSGDLIIPFDSDPKYHYWNGGQPLVETLKELSASEETIKKHTFAERKNECK